VVLQGDRPRERRPVTRGRAGVRSVTPSLTALLTGAIVAWPLALAALVAFARSRWHAGRSWLVALAPLPALAVALSGAHDGTLELPWLFFGATWEADGWRRAMLAAAALVWTIAGVQGRARLADDARPREYEVAWLLALAGNLGTFIARDVASFYGCFALMSFAAYPLVIHDRSRKALAAGRLYLVMTIVGEVLILAGLVAAAGDSGAPMLADLGATIADTPRAAWIVAALWLGFGVKTAVPVLHVWLPTTHASAPTPMSATLGGAIMNSGIVGLLATLPLGQLALPRLGLAIGIVGVVGALGGAAIGVTQRKTKHVLGYSSVSQMGMMTATLGAAITAPAAAGAVTGAAALFAVHHGLAKATLFLGVDVARHAGALPRRAVQALFAIPAFVLAGVPLTSGAASKLASKAALAPLDDRWPWLVPLLTLAAAGTTLLAVRALRCLLDEVPADATRDAAGPVTTSAWPLPWFVAITGVLTAVWWLPLVEPAIAWPGTSVKSAADLLWPVALGLSLASLGARAGWPRRHVPAGDLAVPVTTWIEPRLTALHARVVGAPGLPQRRLLATLRWRLRPIRRRLHTRHAEYAVLSGLPVSVGMLVLGVLLALWWR